MLSIINHPLAQIKLTKLRQMGSQVEFRQLMHEIGLFLAIKVFEKYQSCDIIAKSKIGYEFKGQTFTKPILLVPILRAGLGLVSAFMEVEPDVRIAHLGLERQSDLSITTYLDKLPVSNDEFTVVLDPMLATGHSLKVAIDRLKELGHKNIVVASVIAAPEGVKYLEQHHSDVDIFTIALDEKLNEKGYIIPGLGDAGDRLY